MGPGWEAEREAASWDYYVFGGYYNGGPQASNILVKGDAQTEKQILE